MSTEREAKAIIGYDFTHQELLSLIEIHNNNNFSKEWLNDNEKYHAEIGEAFANCYELETLYIEDANKCHLLGFEIKNGSDYVEALNHINKVSVLLMDFFQTDQKPKIHLEIFSF